jgi:hypothetical protein
MIRSVLALAALLALAVGSGTAFANCGGEHVSNTKQTVASVDGKSSKPIIVPKSGKDS